MEAMTPQEIKKLLQKYYDLPAMIAEEQELLEELKKEEGAVSVASPSLSGMPQPKGATSDPVARAAEHEDKRLEHEMDACRRRIAHYREERAFCTVALATLGRAQRRILELAYLGPKDPQKRRTWVRRPWSDTAKIRRTRSPGRPCRSCRTCPRRKSLSGKACNSVVFRSISECISAWSVVCFL